jgi:alpha-L-rhamnosidase
MKNLIAFLALSFITIQVHGQSLSAEQWKSRFWNAKWIAHPDAMPNEFGVFHFRKELTLDADPLSYVVHVSGDNLFRLYVNGTMVCTGPARSDPANWNFETIDIAGHLRKGKNFVSATVWNFADFRAYAQTSYETGFILQGNSDHEFSLNTGIGWQVLMDSAYKPLPIDRASLQAYVAVASGEIVDGNRYAWGFESENGNALAWKPAKQLWYSAKPRSYGTDGNWQLVPTSIPRPVEIDQEFNSERSGYIKSPGTSLAKSFPWNFPAKTKISLLLDQGMLTNAYPQLLLTSGKNAVITLTYAEAMTDAKRVKGNRNEVEGKTLIGISDRYISDGAAFRMYSPLHYRTFRYVRVDIETKDEPLVINKIDSRYTGYPFEERGKFVTNDPGLQKIWDVGWRTAKLCAVDTYFDCPYYEQLQYVGDTRIQALISLYVSGDDRLMKKAIDDIYNSFIPEGLTQSRYPSRDLQVIPTFSLWWVCMVHDHFMHRKDDAFIRTKLNGVENVIQWYEERMTEKGILGPLSWWQFVDWSWPWVDSLRVGGVPPGVSKGGSSIVTLQYAYTLARAAELMNAYGRRSAAVRYEQMAKKYAQDVFRLCWDSQKGLLADTPEKTEFSQHANILGILTNAVEQSRQKDLLQKIITDKSIIQATYYFKFYMFEAMKKTGIGNEYLGQLKPWYDMLDNGLTTFAENPEPTRSDCHAWSASPLYEMLSMVAGVMPAAPGFSKVLIKPNVGYLSSVISTVPHPAGDIKLSINKTGRQARVFVELPPGISGELEWEGRLYPLTPGRKEFNF